MSYPPPHGPTPPQPQWGPQPHGPQPYWAPPPPPPGWYSAEQSRQERVQRRARIAVIIMSVVMVLIVVGCLGIVLSQSRPRLGDCLAGTDKRMFGGVEIVDCDSPEARWVVVVDGFSEQPCKGRGNGEEIVSTRSKSKYGSDEYVEWAVCAEPK